MTSYGRKPGYSLYIVIYYFVFKAGVFLAHKVKTTLFYFMSLPTYPALLHLLHFTNYQLKVKYILCGLFNDSFHILRYIASN
jgi:hypothetical protein